MTAPHVSKNNRSRFIRLYASYGFYALGEEPIEVEQGRRYVSRKVYEEL